MNRIIHRLYKGWHFRRWLYLIMGVLLMVQAFQTRYVPAELVAGFLLLMAVTGSGCCGSAGCALPRSHPEKDASLPR